MNRRGLRRSYTAYSEQTGEPQRGLCRLLTIRLSWKFATTNATKACDPSAYHDNGRIGGKIIAVMRPAHYSDAM